MYSQAGRGDVAVQELADSTDEDASIPLLVQQKRTGEEDCDDPT
jgi:hypothetical protein